MGFAAQILHLAGGHGTGGITGKAALSGLHEFLGPDVILQALGDPFAAAQLGNAVIAAKVFEYDPDLVLGGKVPTGLAANILHYLFGRGLRRRTEGYPDGQVTPFIRLVFQVSSCRIWA